MIQLGFCSTTSVVAYPVTCIYVNCLAKGSLLDQKPATGLKTISQERGEFSLSFLLPWPDDTPCTKKNKQKKNVDAKNKCLKTNWQKYAFICLFSNSKWMYVSHQFRIRVRSKAVSWSTTVTQNIMTFLHQLSIINH